MRRSNRRGFTFIELLIVMVVMGVLAGIGVPRIRNMKERSYQATLRSDLGALRTAEEAYYTENLRYTTDLSALDFRRSIERVDHDRVRGSAQGVESVGQHMRGSRRRARRPPARMRLESKRARSSVRTWRLPLAEQCRAK